MGCIKISAQLTDDDDSFLSDSFLETEMEIVTLTQLGPEPCSRF